MKSIIYLFYFNFLANLAIADRDTYRAAVVAYTPDLTADKPLDRLYTNVKSYLSFIDQAGEKNADIIVFPEDGLTGWYDVITYPDIVKLVSTHVPNPKLSISPCTSPNKNYSKALVDFSCAALKNKVYVVVNLVEEVYDEKNHKYVYYNSDVVFDKSGRVVSKYYKINLLNENLFERGTQPVSFTTDFDVTFGLYTCFDIVFKNPAIDVLLDPAVTDILFPVAWFSHLPFLQGLSVHHGYVVSKKVNLLAAGLHDPEARNGGAAIYLANGKIAKVYLTGTKGSKLLIEDVPKIHHRKLDDESCQVLNESSEPTAAELADIVQFKTSWEDMSNYTFKEVDLSKNNIVETICGEDGFCCTFDVTLKATPKANYAYKFVAYNGRVQLSETDRLGTRSCAIVACKDETNSSCGKRHKQPPTGVTFKKIELKGVFPSKLAHYQPSTLRFDLKPLTNYIFCRKSKNENEVEVNLTTSKEQSLLLTFGIYGRSFQ